MVADGSLKQGERSTFNPAPDERIEAGDTLEALRSIQALSSNPGGTRLPAGP
jgi:hypothetical protein